MLRWVMLRRYELHPNEIRLLDYYGGAEIVPINEYYRQAGLRSTPRSARMLLS